MAGQLYTYNTSKPVTGTSVIGDRNSVDVTAYEDPSHMSSFGDKVRVTPEAVVQMSAQYGLPHNSENFSATGGAATTEDNMFKCTTGTSVGGYGVIGSFRPLIYREGQGMMARFTSIFDSTNAVANSLQFAGMFNVQDTIAFGYRGTSFGIIHDSYGAQETRTLTVTTAGNGNLTLTLNSVEYVIAVTSGTEAHNAYEIVEWINANQSIWNAQQVGDTVVVQMKNVVAAAGTYSISGASVSGSFSTQATGLIKDIHTVAQASWNGTDVSSWFDPSEGNIYMIQISYLGFGPFKFYIMNTNTDRWELVHTMRHNTDSKPSISNRALKIGWTAASLGSTTDITVKGGSCAGFIDGKSSILRHTSSHGNSNSSVGTSFVSVLNIGIKRNFKGKATLGRIVPFALELSSDSTKETRFIVVKNASLDEYNYQSHHSDEISLIDTVAHAFADDGEEIYEGTIGAGGAKTISLKETNIELLLGTTLTIYARVVSGSAADVTAALVWKEDI